MNKFGLSEEWKVLFEALNKSKDAELKCLGEDLRNFNISREHKGAKIRIFIGQKGKRIGADERPQNYIENVKFEEKDDTKRILYFLKSDDEFKESLVSKVLTIAGHEGEFLKGVDGEKSKKSFKFKNGKISCVKDIENKTITVNNGRYL